MAESRDGPPRLVRSTVRDLLATAVVSLQESAVPTPRLDAELLLARAANQTRMWVLTNPDAHLASDMKGRFEGFIRRRRHREPVSRILARRAFWSHTLEVTPAVLDPRPDSETLIETVLEAVGQKNQNDRLLIADLGTGSGCLLLALLAELPVAVGIGIDRELAAVTVARRNARALGLAERASFIAGDWGAALNTGFDIIVCNPPYLTSQELKFVQPEVRFDPPTALDGGSDGFDAYRVIIPQLHALLAVNGRAFLEVGYTQAVALGQLANDAGLIVVAVKADLAGHDRCVVLRTTAPLLARKKEVGLESQAD